MAIREAKINSILAGMSPATYYANEGQFEAAIAIDPDYPISSSSTRTSGFAVPIGHTKFSSTELNSAPVSTITTPKNTNTYVVTRGGKLISYDSTLTTPTTIGTVTGSVASSAFYYNNYIYILGTGASADDVSRYGPLDGAPALANGYWKTTLGLTALTNTTYPTLRGVALPNHWGHVHGDNAAYFTDFKNGQGLIHKIQTTKTTSEGDTNSGSSYNALDLPYGFYPTDIENISTNLFIIGTYSPDSSTTIVQGKGSFVIWDPTNTVSFFLGPVPLEDPLATAAQNVNGVVHIWSGNGVNGVRVSKYIGGESTVDVCFLEEGLPPPPSAVDTVGNRIVWGGFTTYPTAAAVAWAYGSKNEQLPTGIHCVARATSSDSTNQNITTLKYVQQGSNIQPKLVLGWHDGTGDGMDKYSSSATLGARLRLIWNLGQKGKLNEMTIPLGGAVDANTTITPTVYLDDASSSVSLPVINNTNYPGARQIYFSPTDLASAIADNNIAIEFVWSGTTPTPIGFPLSSWFDMYRV